jgi:hypothetical protein
LVDAWRANASGQLAWQRGVAVSMSARVGTMPPAPSSSRHPRQACLHRPAFMELHSPSAVAPYPLPRDEALEGPTRAVVLAQPAVDPAGSCASWPRVRRELLVSVHATHRAEFRCVPESLGIGRPGAPATYPRPDFTWTHATMILVAHMLRAFHDASRHPPADVVSGRASRGCSPTTRSRSVSSGSPPK